MSNNGQELDPIEQARRVQQQAPTPEQLHHMQSQLAVAICALMGAHHADTVMKAAMIAAAVQAKGHGVGRVDFRTLAGQVYDAVEIQHPPGTSGPPFSV